MKKMTAGILTVTLASSLYAGNTENYSEGKTFIGAEVGYSKLDSSANILNNQGIEIYNIKRESDSDVSYGFHIGAEDNDWRTTLLYEYYNNGGDTTEETTHKGGLYLDYFIWSSEADGFAIKPYIGGHVGYMSYELTSDIGNHIDEVLADDSNVYYGGQIGIAITASAVLQIDLSYRYSLTNLHDMTGLVSNGNSDVDVDSMSGFVFGINYFF